MIEQIITGMATKIASLYPDCTIYTEPIEQGLIEPAFYIHCINVDQSDLIAKRFKQSLPFEVVYFPLNGVSDINTNLSELLVNLRTITLQNGQKLNGHGIKQQMIDGECHIFADYDIVVSIVADPVDPMDELKITGGLNG